MSVDVPQPAPETRNEFPLLSPRCWHGMRTWGYLRMLAKNRFRVHPRRWPMAALLLPISGINSLLFGIQELLYGRQIRGTRIEQAPVFVLGHWRTGTTYLHRLLACDDRFAYPTLYDSMAANHFVLTAPLVKKLLQGLLPKQRPMDKMSINLDDPEEDEFAQVAMGGPTILYRMAFPNHPVPHTEWLDMEGVSDQDRQRFQHGFLWFLKALTFLKKKRLVLKYPGQTGRIGLLAEMFPQARFVHLTRNPSEIFPSTRRNWEAMDFTQGFQIPHHKHLDEFIYETLTRMYRGFERQRKKIDPAMICDLRYEELVRDPIGQLSAVYAQLDLGDFEYVRSRLESEVAAQKKYRASSYALAPKVQAELQRRWGFYMEKYGYPDTARSSSSDQSCTPSRRPGSVASRATPLL